MVQLIYDHFLPNEVSQAEIKEAPQNGICSRIHTFVKLEAV